MIAIVVKKGQGLAHTLASLQFKYYGEKINNLDIVLCDNWVDGFSQVETKYTHGLFVKAGTVFKDIQLFLENLKNYPHRGGIGHIVDPIDSTAYYYLDEQCFFLDLTLIDKNDFDVGELHATNAIRSKQNIHHNYTPLTLKKDNGHTLYADTKFGSKIISSVLSKKNLFVNWNNTARQNKQYLYDQDQVNKWMEFNEDYDNVATTQLWIFNNEHWEITHTDTITSPASGFFWIFNIIHNTNHINLIDISKIQIEFAECLWNNWNGNDYGEFVFNFIQKNQVVHYNIGDTTQRDRLETLKLKKRKYFVDTVNSIFDKLLFKYNIKDFQNLWNDAKKNKSVLFVNNNIIDWVLKNQPSGFVWKSNVDSYKYTLLHNTYEDIDRFTNTIAID